jgi:hypothetical protein
MMREAARSVARCRFLPIRRRSRSLGRSEERRIVRTMVIAVPVAALLLVVAGCGGSSSSTEDSTTAIESAGVTDTTGGTDTSAGTDTDSGADTTDSAGDLSLEACPELNDLSAEVSKALSEATSGTGEAQLDAIVDAYDTFADEAPEEIRDAFKTLAEAFGQYVEALGDIDVSPGETPNPDDVSKMAEAAKAFSDTRVTAATAEIEAWVKKNCTSG